MAESPGKESIHEAKPDGPAVLTLAELVELALGAGRPLVLAIELKHPSPDGWDAEDAVLAGLSQPLAGLYVDWRWLIHHEV